MLEEIWYRNRFADQNLLSGQRGQGGQIRCKTNVAEDKLGKVSPIIRKLYMELKTMNQITTICVTCCYYFILFHINLIKQIYHFEFNIQR